jgi:peroxiredoxin
MKTKLIRAGAALFLLACHGPLFAAETRDVTTELSALVEKINAKLVAGRNTEADLDSELTAFDTLLAAHKGEKTDDVSQILVMKASVYLTVLHDADKALVLIRKLKTDFPETTLGRQADEMITGLEKQAEQEQIQRRLAIGSVFPDFAEKDTSGRPLSVANYKGKVVLVDFWATWCPPCLAELPNVVKTYQQDHAKGFEIIGISLDREGDGDKLAQFTKDHDMPWPQFFDGQYWNSKLAAKYGVNSIPCTFLLDDESRIIGKNLRDDELSQAVAKALAAK